mmetsp:Transcript_53549/g.150456  ORF Transcript_53549/g.150456 Transcript_53549/m.150456 type:complete len:283 (-) Transcript_53549:86-934(-)
MSSMVSSEARGQSSSKSSSCPRRRVMPHCKSSLDKTPSGVNSRNNVSTCSRAASGSRAEKEVMIAFLTNSCKYGFIPISPRRLFTSPALKWRKYSSMQCMACRLNSFSSAATFVSIARPSSEITAWSALDRTVVIKFSGSFVSKLRLTTSPPTQPMRMERRVWGAFGESMAMSSQVQNNFSKERTKAAESMIPRSCRARARSTMARWAVSPPSMAERIATTPNSSASPGQPARSSCARTTASSTIRATKYSFMAPETSFWNRGSVHVGGNSSTSSSSFPNDD